MAMTRLSNIGGRVSHTVTFPDPTSKKQKLTTMLLVARDLPNLKIKHYPSVQANDPDADWLIAKGFIAREDTDYGTALRSMRSPGGAYRDHKILGSDIQVGHMSRYINTTEDGGGVHMNSGIPNRAFYLASYEMGGGCWEKEAC